MASSSSSLHVPKVSPLSSSSSSIRKPGTTLDVLISHLLASKRSLNSIHIVHHATNVLSEARNALEATTVLAARTNYLRRSFADQLKILQKVQFELEDVSRSTQVEISTALQELDFADERLTETIQSLKSTKVEAGFKPSSSPDTKDLQPGGPKDSLHDFVDAAPMGELKDRLKTAIDTIQEEKHKSEDSMRNLAEDLESVSQALSVKTASSSSIRSELQPQDVAALLKGMDNHATEMGQGLESLVKHFDLCVSSIKHTEGGGAMIAHTVSVGQLPEGISLDDFDTPTEELTTDEKKEMLNIVGNDAAEVDDVVAEIQERIEEMENRLEQLLRWKEEKRTRYDEVVNASKTLEHVSSRLAGYVGQSCMFAAKWSEEKAKIEEGIAGLIDLCEVYGNFLEAYDGLLVEVVRRKGLRKEVDKIVQDTQTRLQKLYNSDLAERDAFRSNQGRYLPSDIWQGLTDLPARFSISRVDDGTRSIPDIRPRTVEEARNRLKGGIIKRD